jgi:hypothetical protein
MKPITKILSLVATTLLAACASTIQLSSLEKPKEASASIIVSKFSFAKGILGLDAGVYKIEYESPDGFFFRGPGLAVQVPPAINTNKVNYPDSKFPGGLFVPRSGDTKGYRLYYYQLNIAGSPAPGLDTTAQTVAQTSAPSAGPVAAGVGAGLGAGIVGFMIESGRGQIVLTPPTDEINIASFTAKP